MVWLCSAGLVPAARFFHAVPMNLDLAFQIQVAGGPQLISWQRFLDLQPLFVRADGARHAMHVDNFSCRVLPVYCRPDDWQQPRALAIPGNRS
jgi:hypothetical protein